MIKTLSYWSLLSWREQFPKKEKKVKENTTVRRRDGALEKNSHYLVESVGVLLFVIWDQKFWLIVFLKHQIKEGLKELL